MPDYSVPLMEIQPSQAATETPSTLMRPLHIRVGASLQSYRYVEPGLVSHSGVLIGAWLNWLYQVPFYTGEIQSEIASGQLDYSGALCDVNTGDCLAYKAKTSELIVKISHRLGWQLHETTRLFLGLGYRFLFDKGEGVGFYRRVGQYWYLPLGFSSTVVWKELNTHLIFDLEYGFFLKGAMESKLSDVNSTYSDIRHTQDRGQTWRFSVGLEPQASVDTPRPWIFSVFYEGWSIPQSEKAELLISGQHVGKYYYEPENHSSAYGLRVGWFY